jgi:alpha,alpha-trehalose phosphorylase
LPDILHCIHFHLTYRGQVLEVNVGHETTDYRLKTGSGLTIRHEEEEVKLSPNEPFVTRANRKQPARLTVSDT